MVLGERCTHLHKREAREEERGAADRPRHKVGDTVEERLVVDAEVVELGEEVVEVNLW